MLCLDPQAAITLKHTWFCSGNHFVGLQQTSAGTINGSVHNTRPSVVNDENFHQCLYETFELNSALIYSFLIYWTTRGRSPSIHLSKMSSRSKKDQCQICGGALQGNQRRWLFGGQNKKTGQPQTPTGSLRGGSRSQSSQSSSWGEYRA